MTDYRFSKFLEVQLRALDYWVLRQNKTNTRDLLFNIPLTEKQVQSELYDYSMSFLDPFVQIQISEGKPEYEPLKSQLIANNDFSQESNLNFTPY